ncbi:MAG: hypothetical protein M1825_006505 [Sarcosagium campestre]|nr:MAG: hypothetical protein M1825_006505 [Sarcosagium campestre]
MTTQRANLHYEVRFTSDDRDRVDDLVAWLRSVHARRRDDANRRAELDATGTRVTAVGGVIYTTFRRDCELLATRLCSEGFGAKAYHAGLSNADKDDRLRGWLVADPGYDIVVATTAFGMGIDKLDVRFVIHHQIPKSFEGFYQEAGRAGRDGKAAVCMLYYAREDRDRALYLLCKDLQGREEASARIKSFEAVSGSLFPSRDTDCKARADC